MSITGVSPLPSDVDWSKILTDEDPIPTPPSLFGAGEPEDPPPLVGRVRRRTEEPQIPIPLMPDPKRTRRSTRPYVPPRPNPTSGKAWSVRETEIVTVFIEHIDSTIQRRLAKEGFYRTCAAVRSKRLELRKRIPPASSSSSGASMTKRERQRRRDEALRFIEKHASKDITMKQLFASFQDKFPDNSIDYRTFTYHVKTKNFPFCPFRHEDSDIKAGSYPSRVKWTAAERQIVRKYASKPPAFIVERLKESGYIRSIGSVCTLVKEDIASPKLPTSKWTAMETTFIEDCVHRGKSLEQTFEEYGKKFPLSQRNSGGIRLKFYKARHELLD